MTDTPHDIDGALEALNELPHEEECTPTVKDIGCWAIDHADTIRHALQLAKRVMDEEIEGLSYDEIRRLKNELSGTAHYNCPDCGADFDYSDVVYKAASAYAKAAAQEE